MDTQVIVVGAGPVGLMLAAELRLGGADVIVLEKLAAPTTESRASTLHARTMEIFDQRGLLPRFAEPPNDPRGHFGGLPLDFGGLATRYPGLWKVPQAQVEEVLGEQAARLGARIKRVHEVRGLTVTDERVTAEVAAPGGYTTVTGEYLVGCDGEDSSVRRLGGFGFPGADASLEMLRADVTGIDVRERRFERLPRGLAIASSRAGITRVMVLEFGRRAVPSDQPPAFSEVAAAWGRVTGEDISDGTPIWINSFGNANRQAARYRTGRVLLAGDAAHQQMPTGGQALNLGLQDAANLGWKLAAEVTGRAAPGLLDTYHQERHAVGKRVLANIGAQALLLLGGGEVEAVRSVLAELLSYPEVSGHLTGMVSGLDVRYEEDSAPLAGARMPHACLRTSSGLPSTSGLLHAARVVLVDLSADSERHAELAAAVSPWETQADLVAATAERGTALDGCQTVLLRPDGYVAWTGDEHANPRSALARLYRPSRVIANTSL